MKQSNLSFAECIQANIAASMGRPQRAFDWDKAA